jgi:energy-coupling factor transporter ATP-binding protein EcfA2
MKLTHIRVDNFLGARAVDVQLTKRVNLFAGANGAGKSSIRDAVALALTGDLGRVPLKKSAGQLVTEDSSTAIIEVHHDAMADTPAFVSISAAGKMVAKTPALSPLLPYVLDAQRFARMTPDERRAFMFGLMNLGADGPAVCGRLAARGLDMVKAARIAPLLRAGFDAAAKEAKAQATQAKGAWKAVTGGETYGSEKAKTWKAPMPGAAVDGEPTDTAMLKSCEAAIEQWQREVGRMQAQQQHRQQQAAKLPALQEAAGRLTRAQTKLATDETELASRAEELERTRAAAGTGPRVGLVHELGWAVHNLVMFGDSLNPKDETDARVLAALAAYEREHGKVSAAGGGDPEAAARLPGLTDAHALLVRAVANDRRDIDAAKLAQAQAAEIAAELAHAFDGEAITAAQAELTKLKAEQIAISDRLNLAASAKRAAEAARQRTVDAAQHHADVHAWDAIGDALSPAGIPAEMLAEALCPMNDSLAGHAVSAEWPRVGIDADMSITAAGRAYGLLSESERWRCDAMLAAAVAQLSGVRMLVLDRFDVLDLQGRGDLIAWLDILASDGDIDTALIFGTLKALPSQLPTTIAAHWLANGVCESVERVAMAGAA